MKKLLKAISWDVFFVFLFLLVFWVFVILMIVESCSAEQYRITPKIYNNKQYPAGSTFNPYIVRDKSGRKVGEMKSHHYDLNPNDGISDPGTLSNPWVIDWNK
jgi:hypothetical protein